MAKALTLEEQETNLSMTGDDHKTWHVFSDDSVMQRKLESIGAVLVRETKGGVGRFYTLSDDQVLLRKGKRKENISDEQRAIRSERMKAINAAKSSGSR